MPMRRFGFAAFFLTVTACGAPTKPAPVGATQAPRSEADSRAPGWTRDGDAHEGKASYFVCEGGGKKEDEALAAAGALCDDKICKLCGVEIESVLVAEEKESGPVGHSPGGGSIDVKHKVVERCRMSRTEPSEVTRKSVDCGPNGCAAWIQVRYTDAQKVEACKRLQDGNFAGPQACQADIDAFSKVQGYAAERFRERVKLIGRAMVDCADIDVRPTPLMGSLDAKLKAGMSSFNAENSDTPDFLQKYWLAPDPPLWKQFEEDPKFVSRLRLLKGYLAQKVLVMDVVEASQPDDLDSPAAVKRIAETCEAIAPDLAYGVEHTQRLAIDALYDRWFTHRLTVDVTPVERVVMAQYPPESLGVSQAMEMAELFSIGDTLDEAEWAYLFKTPATGPGMRRGLEVPIHVPNHVPNHVPSHGTPEVRRVRFKQALERALVGADAKTRPRRFENTLPNDGMFLLSVEADLPPDLRAHVDWTFLKDLFHRTERKMSHADAVVYLDHMGAALRTLPSDDPGEKKNRTPRCLGLSDDLKFLADEGRPTDTYGDLVCTCLSDVLGSESLTLVNRHDLYARALMEKLPCVAPLP